MLFSEEPTEKAHQSIKNGLSALSITPKQIQSIFSKHSLEKIQDSLDLLNLSKKNSTIINEKTWLLSCLSRGFDMTALEKSRVQQQTRNNQLLAEQKKKQQDKEQTEIKAQNEAKIDQWIKTHPEKYQKLTEANLSALKKRGDINS